MKKERDQEIFLQRIKENKGIILKISNVYCSNSSCREDLNQEIIYQLWRSFQHFEETYRFSTWMYRVALNVAITFYRKEKKEKEIIRITDHQFEHSDLLEENTETDENINLLLQFIHELKELDRALMILYLETKTYQEIAEILGLSETNVASKISRIKEKIKQSFLQLK